MYKLNFIEGHFYQKWDKTTKYIAMHNTSDPSSVKNKVLVIFGIFEKNPDCKCLKTAPETWCIR